MMHLMTATEGNSPMNKASAEILVFTPTPNEFKAVSNHVAGSSFKNFIVKVVESGPGKINAAFKTAAEIMPRLATGRRPSFVIGAGTSGSLSVELTSGEMVVSSSVVISDWCMENDSERLHGDYGLFSYHSLEPQVADEIALSCPDPTVAKLMGQLEKRGFKRGRIMTSDTFVAGPRNKLNLGREFKCLACDMESGAYAYAAQRLLGGLPWFNLRVVADTLDESLHDYFNKEIDMVNVLGAKTAQALTILDELLLNDGS